MASLNGNAPPLATTKGAVVKGGHLGSQTPGGLVAPGATVVRDVPRLVRSVP